ncbi:hypothetical protein AB0C07_09395 [Actinoplanes missouriensis]|uniref:hypothetical protein n=1 Tax=Actinoplanes missouriensis TaxID=1866 RepID=UPI0033FCB682
MTKKVAAWLRTHGVRIAAGAAVVAAVAVALRGRVPDPVEVGNVLAAATVLGCRIAPFWLLLPAGLAAYLRLRRVQAPTLV